MKDIEALLKKKKKRLTGKEAALLIIADNFQYFRGRTRLLTDADRRDIAGSLKSLKSIKDFNTYTRLATHLQETMASADATIAKMEATINELLIEVTKADWINVIRNMESLTPQIMTQKQYEDMKKLQREMKLKETLPLTSVISKLVEEAYPEYESFAEANSNISKDFSEAFNAGYNKLMELIDSGLLEVKLPEEKALTPERYYSLLKSIEVSREALYKAGIDRDYIDTYEPGFNEETGGTLAGVAILQEPKDYQIDERGYYLFGTTFKEMKESIEKKKTMLLNSLKEFSEKARELLESFFEYVEIVKAYSELLEYDFYGHAKTILDTAIKTVNRFNESLEQNKEAIMPEALEEEPPKINIDSLKPSPEAIEKMKKSIDIYEEPWTELFQILRGDA
jgi:hypothetical protein